jgi:site-specific DNA-methyltransferase (adenine-specific)
MLIERIINMSSNEGDVVLDPYMGSGTTIEAAAAHGRKWIGIDMTHHAIGIATKRLNECGIELQPEQVIGVPADLASARKLKQDSARQFDAWCALQCGAYLQDEDTKGDDKGRIVGIKPFASIAGNKEHSRRCLYAATLGDPPTMADIKNTLSLMKKYGCEVGKLFCFEMPEDPQVLLAISKAPAYADDMRQIPGLELITIRDLLSGCSAPNLTSEYRERRMRDLSRQMELV